MRHQKLLIWEIASRRRFDSTFHSYQRTDLEDKSKQAGNSYHVGKPVPFNEMKRPAYQCNYVVQSITHHKRSSTNRNQVQRLTIGCECHPNKRDLSTLC